MSTSLMRVLVTAGNTRERIDRVRDWGNIFTGNTGLEIARAAAASGAAVDLLTSNAEHRKRVAEGHGCDRLITPFGFISHAELRNALASLMGSSCYDAVYMTAAVADYRPAGAYEVMSRRLGPDGTEMWQVRTAQAGKVKSCFDEMAVLGQRTEKLVDLFRTEWRYEGLLVKFKLEVGISEAQLLRIAHVSRAASSADYLVANTLEMVNGDRPGAYLVSSIGERWIDRPDLAKELAKLTLTPSATAT